MALLQNTKAGMQGKGHLPAKQYHSKPRLLSEMREGEREWGRETETIPSAFHRSHGREWVLGTRVHGNYLERIQLQPVRLISWHITRNHEIIWCIFSLITRTGIPPRSCKSAYCWGKFNTSLHKTHSKLPGMQISSIQLVSAFVVRQTIQ